jgi:hypothetical protein
LTIRSPGSWLGAAYRLHADGLVAWHRCRLPSCRQQRRPRGCDIPARQVPARTPSPLLRPLQRGTTKPRVPSCTTCVCSSGAIAGWWGQGPQGAGQVAADQKGAPQLHHRPLDFCQRRRSGNFPWLLRSYRCIFFSPCRDTGSSYSDLPRRSTGLNVSYFQPSCQSFPRLGGRSRARRRRGAL